ncbi:Gfo/Idh/MocA family oxidoreductase [Flavobacteriaceae bacterium]|jgi:predicted dehydrogenase|nr:Gfo/Idh/MocA family oxidoreductase [Flavobacteriaceae bacterium]MBT5092229.1 Gfo/Idh/MocA family oxidoreductase [Flavobacteriaceae bacterium]MBT5283434.1 Gfo/Idh/MocA family oxidoreductase [Flavobacteriaceae bacterium]MBT5445866.1 Gfo/Idh/MocA family oxidoreductase [Flavobacteriaceae bacterium]MBT5693967.1 Gfo/Idh/MocA family oxidoreductase [Flavobacteriaceae bacterium]|tara:strand:- start:3428 stop:4741 length:1314 start_codon:yes stop_codon:yes gene_type:complete
MKRKEFIKQSVLIAGAGMTYPTYASLLNRSAIIGANDRLRFGAIGINGMGWADTKALLKVPNVELVAICDVDQNVLEKRKTELDKKGISVKIYSDYRKLLEQKDIDAVVIGTPDHWHALMMIHASEAGKHIYVEKPIGNSIGECRSMVGAQERYGNVVQVGQWQRSQQHFQDAVNYIKTGVLGPIRTVKVWCYQGWMRPDPIVANSAPPKGVDYKSWLGPAPIIPFNSSRFHFHFRWFWDYAGGLMTDWGVHLLDYALLGMEASLPKSIVGLGGKYAYPNLAEETPDTLTTLYEFDNFNLVWDSAMGIDNGSYGRDHGIAFIGNNATLILNRGGWEVIEERQSENKVAKPLVKPSDNGLDKHAQNFIDAIRSNTPQSVNCSVQQGAHVATVAQMGNISYRSGQKVVWDQNASQFTDSAINREYLTSKYQNGYLLPMF